MKNKIIQILILLLINFHALSEQIFSNGFEPPPLMLLNDTGITWTGVTFSGSNEDCSISGSPQDCNQGRDATHNDDSDGHAGFSFTKLDANGNALSASTTSWSCVRDNVTGLDWEVKVLDGGLHGKDDSYSWYNTNSATNGGRDGSADHDWDGATCYGYNNSIPSTFCNTQDFTARVNSQGLCGQSDWRMPDINELHSIAYQSRLNPTIDTNYFPNTATSLFWSSSPDAFYSFDVWSLSFFNSYDFQRERETRLHVRLVRGGR